MYVSGTLVECYGVVSEAVYMNQWRFCSLLARNCRSTIDITNKECKFESPSIFSLFGLRLSGWVI